ncbi:MAG TPA: glycosyltransferase family 4 protein [Sedimentisphaerales bacterium]|nr:glycosyltransferase family 4 protein [Sedimentisphaerales bacterium]
MSRSVRIVGGAFGDPLQEIVFSGVSKYLFAALAKKGVMSGYLSTRQLRPWDVFSHVVDFSKTFTFGKPGISVSWMWRRSTIDKLTARVVKKLESFNDFDAFLQVGTHAIISSERFKHYCFTDMTIVQAISSPTAKDFAAGRLDKSQHAEAIEAQRIIFESCEAIFVNSHWTKDSIVSDYNIEPDKVNVVGVGVSLPLQPLPQRRKESHNIVFIGRNWDHKGGPMLVEALSLVRKKFKDATLTVIGCNPRIDDENVQVLGALDKRIASDMETIERALVNAAVLCVPSIFEAYGICFLEAQLYGIVPITFTGEGRGDAIKDGQTGILLEERTAHVLSEAIIDLFSNPEKTRKMGRAGHEYVMNNLTWDHVAERVLSVIESQCAN